MQAIEIEANIDENHEIHIKLPRQVLARRARVVVMYDEPSEPQQKSEDTQAKQSASPRRFGQFRGQVQMSNDFDEPLPDTFWMGEEQ